MAEVSAPYNFVPLNEKVFFPPWANLVNHDVPFKDGLNGQISLEIKAETPIFIRKPYEDGDDFYKDKNKKCISKEFCHIKEEDKKGNVIGKRYYIPGSSIKGEIANVLEIMSFSKLRFYNDEKRFSQRDWENSKIYNKRWFSADKIRGGWLSETTNGYQIEYSEDEIGRISHKELDNTYKGFSKKYANDYDANDEKYSLALHKYIAINSKKGETISFKDFHFDFVENKNYKKIYKIDKNGEKTGKIVLTGQSSARKEGFTNKKNNWVKAKGKGYEFIFWNSNIEVVQLNNELVQDFFIAYNNHKPKEQTDDWKMWKKQLNNGHKVPIFITLKEGKIEHFGLSMLYKLPYDNSVSDLIKTVGDEQYHFKKDYDLTEALFGSIENEKLKGRLHFGHCFGKNIKKDKLFNYDLTITSGSPKPTFYPYYIKQNGIDDQFKVEDYLTYNNGEISGRKRYPITTRASSFFNSEVFKLPQSKTTTSFRPIKENAEFEGTITFHNLLPVELGALLSAISFHNHNSLRHNIGFAKPLGMGRIKIDYNLKIEKDTRDATSFIGQFEKLMESNVENWLKSKQLKELFAIATPVGEEKEQLAYLKLDVKNNINEFTDIKNAKKALPNYSKFMGITPDIKSQIKEKEGEIDDLSLFKKYQQLVEKRKKIEKLITDKTDSKLKSSDKEGNTEHKSVVAPKKEKSYNLNKGDYLGTVKFFNNEKGFGFITEKITDKDYYVGKDNLCDDIKKGDFVIFNIISGRRNDEKVADRVEIFDKKNEKHVKQQ